MTAALPARRGLRLPLARGSQGRQMRWITERLIAACAGLALGLPPAMAGDLQPPQAVPDFALKSLAGDNLRLSEFRGQIVLLGFWASWCGACREQLAALAQLQQRYAARPLQVLSVSLDRRRDKAQAAAAGLELPVLLDAQQEVVRRYDPQRLPLLVLIDPSGRRRAAFEGYRDGDAARYRAAIDGLLAEEAWLTAGTGDQ